MNKIKFTLLAAGLGFILSCSDDNGNGPTCSNIHSVTVQGVEQKFGECYDGSSVMLQSVCEAFGTTDLRFKYESSGKCPSGEKTQCKSNVPFLGAILHEYGEILRCDK